ARLPRLGEVALEGEVAGAGRLVDERVADQAVVHEARELEEADRLGQSRGEHGRIPRRGAREGPAARGRLGARGDSVWVGGRRGERHPAGGAEGEGGRAESGARARDELAPGDPVGGDALATAVVWHPGSPFLSVRRSAGGLPADPGCAGTRTGRDGWATM